MKIIKLSATDSTNTYLMELSKSEYLEDTSVVVANEQLKGRGQYGAIWQSEVAKSLTFSMFKRFSNLQISRQSGINFAVSLGLKSALEQLNIPEVSIKWPNDIMSYQKKLAGILIENQTKGVKLSASVIGVGLNVNEKVFHNLPQAASMYLNSGEEYILDEVLSLVSEALRVQLKRLDEGAFLTLKEEYEASLFRKNIVSAFEDANGKRFNGIVIGVTDMGELRIETEEYSFQKYQSKEIKLLF